MLAEIQASPKVISAIIAVVGSMLTGGIILIVKKHFEAFDWFRNRRLSDLASLTKNAKNDNLKTYLKTLEDEETFRRATGIDGEGKLEIVLSLLNRGKSKLNRHILRRAQPYIEVDGDNLKIRAASRYEENEAKLFNVFLWAALIFAVLGVLVILFYAVSNSIVAGTISPSVAALLFFVCFVGFTVGVAFVISLAEPNRALMAAKQIRKFLDEEIEKSA
jgi:ABC-type multidrug transport system fused ATPase/permease subunit